MGKQTDIYGAMEQPGNNRRQAVIRAPNGDRDRAPGIRRRGRLSVPGM